jgi:DNA-binding transcriptional MerR regulator
MAEKLPLTLGASALAQLTGVSTDTLRHYERRGLLAHPPRTAGGYRRYPNEAVGRVRLIQRALVIGFSLEELARVFRERATGGAPCRKVRGIVEERLVAIDEQLADLKQLKRDLRTLLDEWDARLGGTPAGQRAHLLDSLAHREAPDLRARQTPYPLRKRKTLQPARSNRPTRP